MKATIQRQEDRIAELEKEKRRGNARKRRRKGGCEKRRGRSRKRSTWLRRNAGRLRR